jgi:TonB family protein
MNQKPDHQYTAEEIRRYLQGDMPEAEMHALEKAALDDPMLADAIEGFQASLVQQGDLNTMQDVEQLNRIFTARYQRTPVRHFPWWQVAAAAVVIIIAGVVTFNYYNNPEKQLAAKQTDTIQQTLPAKENVYQVPDTPAIEDMAVNKSFTPAIEQKRSASAAAGTDSKEINAEQKTGNDALSRQGNKDEAVTGNSQQKDSLTVSIPEVAAPQANREVFAEVTRNQRENNAMHNISGRVLNSNMEPLANASLQPSNVTLQQSNNTGNQLNTDKAGYFNVLSPDTSLIVKVTATGYREQLFRLRNNPAQNQLVLKPVLKGKAAGVETAKKSDREAPKFMVQEAEPQGGWIAFDDYVEKNKVYPAEDSNLAGEVIVTFQVNNQGRLSNFKIVQSLAKGYDEEAIRLIKEGPKWRSLKGKRAVITVIVRF